MNRIEHIGLIPDGSRRWSKKANVSLKLAYEIMMEKLSKILAKLYEIEIPQISVYLLSKYNLQRALAELQFIFNAEMKFMKDLLPPICNIYNVKVNHAGIKDLLPQNFSQEITKILTKTKPNSKYILNLCIAYDPIEELCQCLGSQKKVEKDRILESLWVKDKLDLIIRTGGANTLSNFLPLQSGYCRIYFLEKLFNDIEITEILNLLKNYKMTKLKWGD